MALAAEKSMNRSAWVRSSPDPVPISRSIASSRRLLSIRMMLVQLSQLPEAAL